MPKTVICGCSLVARARFCQERGHGCKSHHPLGLRSVDQEQGLGAAVDRASSDPLGANPEQNDMTPYYEDNPILRRYSYLLGLPASCRTAVEWEEMRGLLKQLQEIGQDPKWEDLGELK